MAKGGYLGGRTIVSIWSLAKDAAQRRYQETTTDTSGNRKRRRKAKPRPQPVAGGAGRRCCPAPQWQAEPEASRQSKWHQEITKQAVASAVCVALSGSIGLSVNDEMLAQNPGGAHGI